MRRVSIAVLLAVGLLLTGCGATKSAVRDDESTTIGDIAYYTAVGLGLAVVLAAGIELSSIAAHAWGVSWLVATVIINIVIGLISVPLS